MASFSEIQAGSAFVEIIAKDKEFLEAMARDKSKFGEFAKETRETGIKMAAAGAAVLTPLLASTAAFTQMGKEMQQASEKTGIEVEQLSLLKYVSDQAQVGFDGLQVGLKQMAKTLYAAEQGGKQQNETLKALGLNAQELKNKLPTDQLKEFVEKFSKMEDGTNKAALAMKVFGKSGVDMIPILNLGSQGMEDMLQHGKSLGAEMSGPQAKAAETLARSIDDLETSFKMVVFNIGGALAPALTSIAEKFATLGPKITEFTNQNPLLISEAVGSGVALTGMGTALALIGQSIGGLRQLILTGPEMIVYASAAAVVAGGLYLINKQLGELQQYQLNSVGGNLRPAQMGIIRNEEFTVWRTGREAEAADTTEHKIQKQSDYIEELGKIVQMRKDLLEYDRSRVSADKWHDDVVQLQKYRDMLDAAQKKLQELTGIQTQMPKMPTNPDADEPDYWPGGSKVPDKSHEKSSTNATPRMKSAAELYQEQQQREAREHDNPTKPKPPEPPNPIEVLGRTYGTFSTQGSQQLAGGGGDNAGQTAKNTAQTNVLLLRAIAILAEHPGLHGLSFAP